MNLKTFILILTIGILTITSCRKTEQLQNEQPAEQLKDASLTKLGDPKASPFSFKHVNKAIEIVKERNRVQQNLVDPCDGTGGGGEIYPTHTYVRFAPQNVDQLSALEEAGMELFDVPLHYDIAVEGDWYQDPSLPADAITYQYTLVPYGYPIPNFIPHTILDQLFLFNENAGEELEPDDWTGGGGSCGQQPTDPNNPSLPPVEEVCDYMTTMGTGDPVINATQYLLENCLNPYEVFQASSILSGYSEDDDNGISLLSTCYPPRGRLQVFNNDINAPEPLKGVKVIARNFFKIDYDLTRADGQFQMSKCYKKKASIKVRFANNRATTRGINGVLKVWQYVFPVHHNIGRREKDQLTNIDFTFPRENNPHSDAARKWVAAATMNAIWDADTWNAQNGLATFPHLRIWLSSRITSDASAPMLNYVLKPGIGSTQAIAEVAIVSAIIDKLLLYVPVVGQGAVILKRVIELNKPDVTLRYGGGNMNNTIVSREIYNIMMHEFSHANHYWATVQQNGSAGSQYWWDNIKYVINNGGYGNKGNNGAQRAAVIEAWGFYAGNTSLVSKYSSGIFQSPPAAAAIRLSETRQLENQRNNNAVAISLAGTGNFERYEGWIPCGFLHDCIDVGETNPAASLITDNVNGYTILGVFRPLRFTNTTVQQYRQNLLLQNSNLQATQVNNLVTQYGY